MVVPVLSVIRSVRFNESSRLSRDDSSLCGGVSNCHFPIPKMSLRSRFRQCSFRRRFSESDISCELRTSRRGGSVHGKLLVAAFSPGANHAKGLVALHRLAPFSLSYVPVIKSDCGFDCSEEGAELSAESRCNGQPMRVIGHAFQQIDALHLVRKCDCSVLDFPGQSWMFHYYPRSAAC